MSLVKSEFRNDENKSLIHSKLAKNGTPSLYSKAVVLEGHVSAVLGSKFSHSGTNIASVGKDKTIKLWNLPIDKDDETPNYGFIIGHKSAVTSVRWSFDDTMLCTSSADKTIGFWDVETGKRLRNGKFHELAVNEVDVSKDSLALSVSDDGYALLWDQREKGPVSKLKTEYPLLSGVINNKGNSFYISGIEPTIKGYDFRLNNKPLWECSESKSSITSIAINSDDTTLVARTFEGLVMSLSANDHIPEDNSRISPNAYEGAVSGSEYQLIRVRFSPNNITIASGSEEKTLTIWNFNSTSSWTLDGHNGTVIDVDYHPSEDIILTSSTDGSIIVREIHV